MTSHTAVSRLSGSMVSEGGSASLTSQFRPCASVRGSFQMGVAESKVAHRRAVAPSAVGSIQESQTVPSGAVTSEALVAPVAAGTGTSTDLTGSDGRSSAACTATPSSRQRIKVNRDTMWVRLAA